MIYALQLEGKHHTNEATNVCKINKMIVLRHVANFDLSLTRHRNPNHPNDWALIM